MDSRSGRTVRDYVDSGPRYPTDYVVRDGHAQSLEGCRGRHLRLVTGPAVEVRLDGAFDDLRSDGYTERVSAIPPSRHLHFFEGDDLVRRVAAALATDSDAIRKVEQFLDELFEELRPGEAFVHDHVVMALLVAVKRSLPDYFSAVAEPLVTSRAAELGALRQFARRLSAR